MNASNHDSKSHHGRYSWLGPRHRPLRERLVEIQGHEGRDATLRCAGEFDASGCDELEAALDDLCRRELDSLRLDLTEVQFLDGYALGLIAATQLRLERRGVELRAAVAGQPRRMFELSGLAESIDLGADPPAADAV